MIFFLSHSTSNPSAHPLGISRIFLHFTPPAPRPQGFNPPSSLACYGRGLLTGLCPLVALQQMSQYDSPFQETSQITSLRPKPCKAAVSLRAKANVLSVAHETLHHSDLISNHPPPHLLCSSYSGLRSFPGHAKYVPIAGPLHMFSPLETRRSSRAFLLPSPIYYSPQKLLLPAHTVRLLVYLLISCLSH